MTKIFTKISNIKVIEKNFRALILDIWGVLWDGIEPYPNAKGSLKELKDKNIPIILLSNATRRAKVELEVKYGLGLSEQKETQQ